MRPKLTPGMRPDYYREWRRKKGKDYTRNCNLKHMYGITLGEYNAILASQKGDCIICHGRQRQRSKWGGHLKHLCVDHDHKTGRVRGLLCKDCNSAIGYLQDDPMVVYAAFRYLVKSRSHRY